MAATQTDLRNALAASIRTHGKFGSEIVVHARPIASPNPPTLFVRGGPIVYDLAFGRGHDEHELTLIALVAFVNSEAAQRNLDELMAPAGEWSVKEAAETDMQLGGLVHSARVESCTGPRTYTFVDREPMLGAEWTVRVLN